MRTCMDVEQGNRWQLVEHKGTHSFLNITIPQIIGMMISIATVKVGTGNRFPNIAPTAQRNPPMIKGIGVFSLSASGFA